LYPVLIYPLKETVTKGASFNHVLLGHRDRIWTLQFLENHLVTGSRDTTVRVWDLNKIQRNEMRRKSILDQELKQCSVDANSGAQRRRVNNTRYNNNNNNVQGNNNNVNDLQEENCHYILGNKEDQHKNSVYWLQFTENRIVTGSADHTVKIWNFSANQSNS